MMTTKHHEFTSRNAEETQEHIRKSIGVCVRVQPLLSEEFCIKAVTRSKNNLQISDVHFIKGAKFSVNEAPSDFSISIIESGSYLHSSGNKEHLVNDGEIAIGNSPLLNVLEAKDNSKNKFMCMNFDEANSIIDKIVEKHVSLPSESFTILKVDSNRNASLKYLFLAMTNYIDSDNSDSNNIHALNLMRDTIWMTAFESLPIVQQALTKTSVKRPAPWQIRRAVEFIDSALRPVTISDVSEEVGVGIRALQVGFKRHLDMTPYDYIKRARLNAINREIRDPERADTVGDIARKWGFMNRTRFVADYEEVFLIKPPKSRF